MRGDQTAITLHGKADIMSSCRTSAIEAFNAPVSQYREKFITPPRLRMSSHEV